MNQRVEVELDDEGRLVIPHDLQRKLGLDFGTALVLDRETAEAAFLRVRAAQPQVVGKDGVLVVQAQASGDIADIIRSGREQPAEALLYGSLAN